MILSFIKNNKQSVRLIYRRIFLGLFVVLLGFATPEVLREITNAVTNKDSQALVFPIVLAIVSTALYLIATSVLKLTDAEITNKWEQYYQNEILRKIFKIKKLKLKQYDAGEIITKATQNIPSALSSSFSSVFSLFDGIGIMAFAIIYMGIINFWLMLIVVAYCLTFKFMLTKINKKVKSSSKKLITVTSSSNSFLIDILNNIFTIRVFSKQKYFGEKLFEKESQTFKANVTMTAWFLAPFELMWFLIKLGEIAIVYGIGGYLAYKGQMDIGSVVAFSVAIDTFAKGTNAYVIAQNEKSAAIPNIEAINTFLHEEDCETEEGRLDISGDISIRFENVSFSFGEKEILKDISFEIKPNEKIMLAGENGQGKTTLLNLMMGLYKPSSGKIYFGGQDISLASFESVTDTFSYISQDSHIIDSSVCENISLKKKYDEKLCDDILTALNLVKVKNNPAPLLSQGEKQRVNIARSLYKINETGKNSKIVFGDEIFSNIDPKNKESIAEKLDGYFQGKIIVMVCHEDMGLHFDKKFVVGNGGVTYEE